MRRNLQSLSRTTTSAPNGQFQSSGTPDAVYTAHRPSSPQPSVQPLHGHSGHHTPAVRRSASIEDRLRRQLAQSGTSSPDYCLAAWNIWAQQGSAGENRPEAVRRMTQWLDQNQCDAELDLSDLSLVSLPNHFPDSLTSLNLSHNELVSLPESLPDSLTSLNVKWNCLRGLPEHLPASLLSLNARHNELSSLPEHLPASLTGLNLSRNDLTSLPNHLPASLTRLNLSCNDLGSLPEHWPESLTSLNVSENDLSALPENLPALLTSLDASWNNLTGLPAHLPASLTSLTLKYNDLISLPEHLPDSLISLNVSHNDLTRLPEQLPASLSLLMVSCNALTRVPENLPGTLTLLNVSCNQLTSLPSNFLTRLSSNCTVYLSDNRFPEQVRSNLNLARNDGNYQGPHIRFSTHELARHVPEAALPQAVACWYDPADQAAVRQQWSAFANEPHAQDFANFLVRLQATVNAGSPDFKAATVQWLSHLAHNPGLRKDSFVISLDATTSCEDRVSLCLNAMRNARLTADVERGDYDRRLPELITLAKGMFRLDQLEGIAREKVKSLPYVDEIEVYLAYQVKLRERLELPVDTADMRYFCASHLSDQDLEVAQTQVQTAERECFADYLASQWQPWQSVLQRLAPERHAQTQAELIEAMGEPFEQRLQQQLQALGLQDNPDARREMGPQVAADIAREIKRPLTRDFLRERSLGLHVGGD